MSGLSIKANEDRPLLGIGLMLIAYLAFSLIDTSAKWLVLAGMASLQAAFMRYVGHFLISLGMMVRQGVNPTVFRSNHFWLVILRAFFLAASTALNFISVRYLPLTLTATILFSAPIIVCALSGPLLNERVGIWRWSAILIGFVGIVVAMRPFAGGFHWSMLLSLAAACSFSCYVLLTRKLAGKVPVDNLQFYTGLIGTLALAPFALAEWQNPSTSLDWVIMLVIGIWGWAGHELLTRAHGYAPATTLSPFSYTFVLFLTIWSFLVFDQLPGQWTILGGAIIILAGLVIWFRERNQALAK